LPPVEPSERDAGSPELFPLERFNINSKVADGKLAFFTGPLVMDQEWTFLVPFTDFTLLTHGGDIEQDCLPKLV
jgi:hypothetical protein